MKVTVVTRMAKNVATIIAKVVIQTPIVKIMPVAVKNMNTMATQIDVSIYSGEHDDETVV